MFVQRLCSVFKTKMSEQRQITAFMKTSQQKRSSVDEAETPPKKVKQDEKKTPEKSSGSGDADATTSNDVDKPRLSPEQKERMEENRVKAQIKMTSAKTHGLLNNMGVSWYEALEAEFSKPYFVKLSKFVEAEREKNTIFPPAEHVWSWTQLCDINDVKVVILGQDPYHGPGQAHGLCFSVQRGVAPPPSLVNMYKELTTDIEGFKHPGHGHLAGWAKQGVLMLNAVLTVQARQANSHKGQGWEQLTDAVISWLNRNREDLVFVLWGAYAQKKGASINKTKHRIIQGVHPSPLSAHRGFFGCEHFSKCNDYLLSKSLKPIDWTSLSD